jgi:hypothetical protein
MAQILARDYEMGAFWGGEGVQGVLEASGAWRGTIGKKRKPTS